MASVILALHWYLLGAALMQGFSFVAPQSLRFRVPSRAPAKAAFVLAPGAASLPLLFVAPSVSQSVCPNINNACIHAAVRGQNFMPHGPDICRCCDVQRLRGNIAGRKIDFRTKLRFSLMKQTAGDADPAALGGALTMRGCSGTNIGVSNGPAVSLGVYGSSWRPVSAVQPAGVCARPGAATDGWSVLRACLMIRPTTTTGGMRMGKRKDDGNRLDRANKAEPREIGPSDAAPEPDKRETGPIRVHHSKSASQIPEDADLLDAYIPDGPIAYDSGWVSISEKDTSVRVVFTEGPANPALGAWVRELMLRPEPLPVDVEDS